MADDEVKYVFRCPLCGEEFDNPVALASHLYSAHSNWKPEDMEKLEKANEQNTEEKSEEEKKEEQESKESSQA